MAGLPENEKIIPEEENEENDEKNINVSWSSNVFGSTCFRC
jgi:hypothetical protein